MNNRARLTECYSNGERISNYCCPLLQQKKPIWVTIQFNCGNLWFCSGLRLGKRSNIWFYQINTQSGVFLQQIFVILSFVFDWIWGDLSRARVELSRNLLLSQLLPAMTVVSDLFLINITDLVISSIWRDVRMKSRILIHQGACEFLVWNHP